jgi:hypothetical protein
MTLEELRWLTYFGFTDCRYIYTLTHTHTLCMMNFENDLMHWIVVGICEN